MDLRLGGKVCLVTGASAGIGRGIVEALSAEGAQTIAVARRKALLEEVADAVAASGAPRPFVLPGDLATEDGPGDVARAALAEFGRVDVVVNNAGRSLPTRWDSPDDFWIEALALNFHAARRLTVPLVPAMQAAGWGRIINITGGQEVGGLNAAIAGKAATHTWAKGLSRALGPDGITVNSIIPGRIKSEQILGRLHADPDERAAFIEREIPLGYFGEPEDLAVLVAFLASPRARYITGEVIRVDGGMYRFAH
ncbi:MAG: SDR family oxidoreductase [Alphaproteobacteria bacterium]|jgi:3-oxoacyl-[acyl-carrier protein] reductase